MKRELVEIDITAVSIKTRLRRDLGDTTPLEQSIRNIGLLYPVIIDRDNVLIAGARRLQACRNAGLAAIPAVRLDIAYDSLKALDVQGDENLCRLPLSHDDLADHIQRKKSMLLSSPRKGAERILSWFRKSFSTAG